MVLCCRPGLNHDSPFWHPAWGPKGWDNGRADWKVLKQLCYSWLYAFIVLVLVIVAGQNVALFGHVVVVCKSLLAVCVPCSAIRCLWGKKDQDCDFAVLCNTNL